MDCHLHREKDSYLIDAIRSFALQITENEQSRLLRATRAYKAQQAMLGLDKTTFDALAMALLTRSPALPELTLNGTSKGRLISVIEEYAAAQESLYEALEQSLHIVRSVRTTDRDYEKVPEAGYITGVGLITEMLLSMQHRADEAAQFPKAQFERG